MSQSRLFPIALSCVLAVLLLATTPADATDCNEGAGPLNSALPKGITPEELIQKFTAKETLFKQARDNYTYTQDVKVQTLDGSTVDGEYHLVQDVLFDDKGNRIENVTYAPQDTLQRIQMTKEDFDEFRNLMPFVFTTGELPLYNILYAGQQHVDEIDTYVFDVAPKKMESDRRYFQGRIWVDNHDLQIVKTCGRSVPDEHKKGKENLTPEFVTYREQIDGQYWFPTYTRADDILHFSNGDVQIREVVKYTNYKRFGAKTRIIFRGEAPQQNPPTPPKKP